MEEQPTELTQEIKDKIDKIITENPKINKKDIALKLGITSEVLKDLYIKERQEEMLKEAEIFSKSLLKINLDDPEIERKFGKAKLALLKLKQVESQHIKETLGKDVGYSKRQELTGKDGGDFFVKAVVFNAPTIPRPIDTQTKD